MSEKKFRKYRKKPIIVEAYQTNEEQIIETLEGKMKANKGDYIIKGIKGELYPCKPDIFHETYKKIEEKRFTESSAFDGFCDIFDNGVTIACMRKEYSKNMVDLLNSLNEENEQLKEEIRAYPINEQYAEEIMQQNQKLHIERNDLRIENEKLKKKLECCEYSNFLNELDAIHEKIDKGDLSDFNPLREDKPLNDYNPLKEKLYYWQCKYYRRDYEHKTDMCTRCNYNGLLNYCLKEKCDKMVKSDYEVTITEFENGTSIGLKKRGG